MKLKNSTIKVVIPLGHIHEVSQMLRAERIKHGPFRRLWNGYEIEMAAEPAITTYFTLKYG